MKVKLINLPIRNVPHLICGYSHLKHFWPVPIEGYVNTGRIMVNSLAPGEAMKIYCCVVF